MTRTALSTFFALVLAAPMADPARLAEVPVGDLPALLGELERVRATLWARLTAPVPTAPNGQPAPAVVDDVREVARIVRRSESWVRKRGHTLPGFHQPGGKGTRVAWSRRKLEAWATTPTP